MVARLGGRPRPAGGRRLAAGATGWRKLRPVPARGPAPGSGAAPGGRGRLRRGPARGPAPGSRSRTAGRATKLRRGPARGPAPGARTQRAKTKAPARPPEDRRCGGTAEPTAAGGAGEAAATRAERRCAAGRRGRRRGAGRRREANGTRPRSGAERRGSRRGRGGRAERGGAGRRARDPYPPPGPFPGRPPHRFVDRPPRFRFSGSGTKQYVDKRAYPPPGRRTWSGSWTSCRPGRTASAGRSPSSRPPAPDCPPPATPAPPRWRRPASAPTALGILAGTVAGPGPGHRADPDRPRAAAGRRGPARRGRGAARRGRRGDPGRRRADRPGLPASPPATAAWRSTASRCPRRTRCSRSGTRPPWRQRWRIPAGSPTRWSRAGGEARIGQRERVVIRAVRTPRTRATPSPRTDRTAPRTAPTSAAPAGRARPPKTDRGPPAQPRCCRTGRPCRPGVAARPTAAHRPSHAPASAPVRRRTGEGPARTGHGAPPEPGTSGRTAGAGVRYRSPP